MGVNLAVSSRLIIYPQIDLLFHVSINSSKFVFIDLINWGRATKSCLR